MSQDEINTIIKLLSDTYGAAAGGAFAALSVLIYGLIKVLRLPGVQVVLGRISPKLTWSSWPKWACALVVLVLTFVAALAAAIAAHVAWAPALIGALSMAVPAALGAMGIDGAETAIKPANPT